MGRVLAIALDDVLADWSAGERLLQHLATAPGELDRARGAQAAVEGPLAAAGGLLGPGSTGR